MSDQQREDEDVNAGDGVTVVGRGPNMLKMGTVIRQGIESMGGVPCFDDRTLGRLSAVHCARHMHYQIDAHDAFERVLRRTTLGNNASPEQQ